MRTFLLLLPAMIFVSVISVLLFLQWKQKKRYAKNGISHKVINFMKMEVKGSTKMTRDDPDFNRSMNEIAKTLTEGKKVLTMAKGKPILISLEGKEVEIKEL